MARHASDWQPPLDGLTDVPIERESIGAMGWVGAHVVSTNAVFRTKPYVYKGLGYDIYEVQPPPKPRKRTFEQMVKARAKRVEKREPRVRHKRRRATISSVEARRSVAQDSYTPPPPPPRLPVWPPPETSQATRLARAKPVRPSPGWKPMSGDDLEDLLEEFE